MLLPAKSQSPSQITTSLIGSGNSILKSKLIVNHVQFNTSEPSFEELDNMFDSSRIDFHLIDIINWSAYPAKPMVQFKIAYNIDEIFVKYFVKENQVRALYTSDQDSKPYTDSCVEFFLIPGNDNIYYNIEMNCIGFGIFKGGEAGNRRIFDPEITCKIRRHTSFGSEGFETKIGNFSWTLTLAIPIKIFSLSEVLPLKGRTIPANFYKCGDELPDCHYLSWSPIINEKPNFHLPQFFGNLYFE